MKPHKTRLLSQDEIKEAKARAKHTQMLKDVQKMDKKVTDNKIMFEYGDEVFCDGAMLVWNDDEQRFDLGEIVFDSFTFVDGKEVNIEFDDSGNAYYLEEMREEEIRRKK